ncbi:MAG: aminotransferase [Gammaproteobacteria bacterium SG8_47]|nr:MAG: aminotransferase [Gammaproteobacteria bacterium SG8_47]
MTDGLLNLSPWGVVIATLVLTHITIASVTIYLHRHQSHNALTLHPVVGHFFRFWLWLTTGMVTKQWVAIHRKHHTFCETADDPHSPQRLGLGKVLWQGSELYRAAARDAETLAKYGHGTPDDWLERNVYSRYPFAGITLMALIDIALFGPIGLSVWAVQMIWIPFWAAGIINGVGHFWGYRNFETSDAATNIVPWGIVIGGEELHNNHHAYSSSARLSNKWWEFDIGWLYIRILQALGLAHVKKLAPNLRLRPSTHIPDTNTLRAILRNRFHVLKLYARKVTKPVLREELRRADQSCKSLLRGVRKLLLREDVEVDGQAALRLSEALERSRQLRVVYQYKQQLKELWERGAATTEAPVKRLQEWCNRAEQTGIEVLEEFAALLRGYSVKAA